MKRRCEPWYQPCGGDGGPFLKRAFLLVVNISVTETLKKWAIEVGRFDLAGVISKGDLIAQEAKYHKSCRTWLYNQYKAQVNLTAMEGQECNSNESLGLCSTIAFKHIAQFIRDKLNSDDIEYIFKMANLTAASIERLARSACS